MHNLPTWPYHAGCQGHCGTREQHSGTPGSAPITPPSSHKNMAAGSTGSHRDPLWRGKLATPRNCQYPAIRWSSYTTLSASLSPLCSGHDKVMLESWAQVLPCYDRAEGGRSLGQLALAGQVGYGKDAERHGAVHGLLCLPIHLLSMSCLTPVTEPWNGPCSSTCWCSAWFEVMVY